MSTIDMMPFCHIHRGDFMHRFSGERNSFCQVITYMTGLLGPQWTKADDLRELGEHTGLLMLDDAR